MISYAAQSELISGQGTKDDAGKPRFSLAPAEALTAIVEVFTYGAVKYTPDNWRNGMNYRRMMDAAERHWSAWKLGEKTDPESGLHHLAHMGCCVMMLLSWELCPRRYRRFDDRWIAGEQLEMGLTNDG
jgi:hypothetical protein